MVTICANVSHAAAITVGVRGAKVGRESTEDGCESDLVLHDLVTSLAGGSKTKVHMTPGVASDLVSFRYHAAEDGRVTC